jgi:hypothetical protein
MNRKQRRQELKKGIPKEVIWVRAMQYAGVPLTGEYLTKAKEIMKRHPKYF